MEISWNCIRYFTSGQCKHLSAGVVWKCLGERVTAQNKVSCMYWIRFILVTIINWCVIK